MNNIKLIKKINESLREKDKFELALEQSGIEFDMGDDEDIALPNKDDMDVDMDLDGDSMSDMAPDGELERIADHWREEGKHMDDEELRDVIGDELEQLEYSPEEISSGIDTVMSMIGRGEDGDVDDMGDEMDMDDMDMDDEPDVDDRQELEDYEQSDEYHGGGIDRI